MVSYGIIDLCDADTGILIHKQVIYRIENKHVYLYRPTTLRNFENKIFNICSTVSSPDSNFFCSIPLRALIEVTIHYLPYLFVKINDDSLCDSTKIAILETAFLNKVLHKLLKKTLNSFFYVKNFVTNEDKNGAKLIIVEKIKGFFPETSIVFKNKENDIWTVINILKDTKYVAENHVKILDSEIYRYYIKKNYKKVYKHYFSYRENFIIIRSQCELFWFEPPKPSVSLLTQFR